MAETKRSVAIAEKRTAEKQRAARADKEKRIRAVELLTELMDNGVRPNEAHMRVFEKTGVKLRGFATAQKLYGKSELYKKANTNLLSTRIPKADVDRLRAMALAVKVKGKQTCTPSRSELVRAAVLFMLDDFGRDPAPWLRDFA